MVARHGEFGALLPQDEVRELRLLWELVAESEPVVVEPETDEQQAPLLFERYGEFVVVVADRGRFTPDGFPGLVERAAFGAALGETLQQ